MSALRRRGLLAAALLTGVLLPLRASGQCVPQSNAAVSISPALISFSTPAIVDFDDGGIVYESTVRVDVDVRGNRSWNLCIASLSPDLGTSGGVTKPLDDLQWQAAGGAWMPVALTPQVVESDRGDRTVVFNVRIVLSWDADVPGLFGTTVQLLVAD